MFSTEEKNMDDIKQKLAGKYFLIAPSPNGACDISDVALVKIIEVEDMTSHAAYYILFKPIAGNYNTAIKDVVFTERGGRGILSYSQAASLIQRDEHKIEKQLRIGEREINYTDDI